MASRCCRSRYEMPFVCVLPPVRTTEFAPAAETTDRREFEWTRRLLPSPRAIGRTTCGRPRRPSRESGGPGRGVDAVVESDLPPAAGLSSSTALLVAFTLALLRANCRTATFEELMEVLPDGEQFVGTRGGGMDHAAVLGSREGCASLISFSPVTVRHIPIPRDWAFLIANSGIHAEKSGAVRERYNAIRLAGMEALRRNLANPVAEHVATEAARVRGAVDAMERDRPERFGELLLASHASLRDRLRVSCRRSTGWWTPPWPPARLGRGSPAQASAVAPWSSAGAPHSPACAPA